MPEETNDNSEILIVDDDRDLAELLGQMCEQEGCPADVAYDGAKAYELHERKGYHMIVTDGLMPGLDGLGLLRKIRQSEHGNNVAVVLMTGTQAAEWRNYGFDRVLQKPVEFKELRECLRQYCCRKGQ